MAIVYALKRFETFLDHLPFTVVTDCEAVASTLKKKDMNKRIARWELFIQGFDCEM